MKTATTTLKNHLLQSHEVEVRPRVIAEWGLNRYHRVVADNTPAEDDAGNDIEVFPIESITRPNRPLAGIAKAIVNQSTVAGSYDSVPAVRYYLGTPDTQYKYWISPVVSDASTNFPLHTDSITNVRPRIEYFNEKVLETDPDVPKNVTANMVRVGIENSWARPDDWDIQYKNSAGTWVTIATNPTVSTNGRYEFYYNGSTWSTTPSYTGSIVVRGVRLVVRSMDKANSYFSLIELSANVVRDITADVMNINDAMELGETDFLTPIGTLSSNTGSINLFNDHGYYTPENAASPYYNMLDRNVKFTGFFDYVLPAGGTEAVQQFEMYSDSWGINYEGAEASVDVGDFSKYFQEIKPAPVLYRDISVQEAVWRICDLVGFNNYELTSPDTDPSAIIKTFWTTGEETVWEVFQELSRAAQTAIYFDAYGTLQIKTRTAAFNTAAPSVWDFTLNTDGTTLPNIVSMGSESVYDSNKVTINYTPTEFEEEKNGFAKMEVVWEPEGVMTLRSSDLKKDILTASTEVWLSPKDASAWPFEGVMNIEGEFIRYKGRMYKYWDTSLGPAAYTTTKVTSIAEQKKIDDKVPSTHSHLSRYTGALVIEERGLWNSEKRDHTIDISGWSQSKALKKSGGYEVNDANARIKHNKEDSTVTISNHKKQYDKEDYSIMHRGNKIDAGYWYLGTRLKFDKGGFYKNDYAGICFNMDGNSLQEGYFLEVTPTINIKGKDRQKGNELRFYSMVGGNRKYFGGDTRKVDAGKDNDKGDKKKIGGLGEAVAVVEGVWVELDIHFSVAGNGDHEIEIDFNGKPAFTATVPNSSGWQHSRISRFGLFARGRTSATFEYVYGIPTLDTEKVDSDSFLDRLSGSWYGQQWLRDWVFEVKKVRRRVKGKWKKVEKRYNQRFYDEFGPLVHEVREMDVKYDTDKPVLASRLYITNEGQAACPEFSANPWGAKFLLVNTSRSNAVVNGDDNLTNPGNTTNQKLVVFGRVLTTSEAGTVTKTDDWAIKRRGEIEVEYSNKWIQNKQDAERLGDWLVTQWSRGVEQYEMEVFGNPLIELTDIVTVTYDDLVDERFFVVGISTSFDAGVKTTLTLRHV